MMNRVKELKQFLIIYFLLPINTIVFALREPPTVQIPNQGTLMGKYINQFRTQRIIGYLGIPYAQPPINERRFNPPVVDNIPSWDGVRNATSLQKGCWSENRKPLKKHESAFLKLIKGGNNGNGATKHLDAEKYSEDCLFLNIYIPEDPPPPDGFAVIIWLHSGDFSKGNASELNPFQLVFKQKIIVITVAFRLGILGFFTSMDGESPGNFGLMDQSAALLWISHNVKLFGGNDKSITLMGHGSGAVSVSLHLTSGEWSSELFNKAIIMSGSSLSYSSVRTAQYYASAIDGVAGAFGCNRQPTSDLLGCLRRVDILILMDGAPIVDWGPIIDDGLSNTTTPFIPDDPRSLIERVDARKVPLLIGFTNMEDSLDVSLGEVLDEGITNEMYDSLVSNTILNELAQIEVNESCGSINQAIMDALNFVYKPYPPTRDPEILRKKFIEFGTERMYASPSILLATYNSMAAKTYVYRFDLKPQTVAAMDGIPSWAGVPHGFDLLFVWGLPYWLMIENQTQWDSSDKRISDIIMTLWANYAKYSEPTKMGVYIKWDQFTVENQGLLIIDRSFNMSDSHTINYQAMQFWNDYYPKVINFASQCCNITNGSALQRFRGFSFVCSISMIVIHILHSICR